MATTRPDGSRTARLACASASGFALLTLAAAAHAATSPPIEPTLAISAVATDNAELGAEGNRRKDLIGEVNAGVIVRSRGARLTVTGDAGLDFIGYARDSEPARVLPRGHLDLNATLLEQFLFFEGDASASRTRNDPLAAQSDTATANTVSTVSLRASPYFAHDFSPVLSARVRSDTTITRNHTDDSSAAPNGSTYQHDVVSIVRKPTPFGVSIDGEHDDTTYENNDASVLKTDLLQATFSAIVDSELLLGLVGGREHAVYSGITQDDTTYGGLLQWRPSPRTSVDLAAGHHYFGTGWNLHLRDRLPRSTVDLSLTRTAAAAPSTLGLTNPDSDPALLLGAILSSRTPESPNSDQAVDDLMQTRNLPGSFTQPQMITSESAQLMTRGQLNLIYSGQRDTIYASAWYEKATTLPGRQPLAQAAAFDSRQWGGSVGLYHRLTPQMSGAAEIEWSSIEALGTRSGDSQHQIAGTLSLTQRLGPHTTLSAGLRHFASHVVLNSTSTSTEVRENQAFAGLRMQY
jgi:uncharacterized protein (PEP-CTERM system associated)